jgi:hypothetical protein
MSEPTVFLWRHKTATDAATESGGQTKWLI